MNICLIVLNWNGWQHSVRCLDSLRPVLNDTQVRLIVCDNGSTDDSWQHLRAWLEKHFTEETLTICEHAAEHQEKAPETAFQAHAALLQTGHNRGFAGGMNVGLRYMLRYFQCEFVWLLNNDLEIATDALQALHQCSQQSTHWGMLGSTILDAQDRHTVQCAGGCRYYPLLTVFRNIGQGLTLEQAQNLPETRLDYAQGAALCLKTEAIQKIGLLNEEYFLFYEELDYAQRLRQAGYEIAWCRHARVYHQGSATIGAHSHNKAKLQQANYYENLSTLKYSRNFHAHWLWLILPVRFSLKLLALLLRRQFFLVPTLFKAYQDFFHKKS